MTGGPRNFTEVGWRVAEKQEERSADKLMAVLGFTPIRFSQPRNSMQTCGIADRLYVHPTRRLFVFYEAKRVGGKQSAAQKAFQQLVQSAGMPYVAGPCSALQEWCIAKCLAHRLPDGNLIALRS